MHLGLESPTHSIVDKSLGCLPTILKILDFSTIKNELFPVIAAVFSKTSSLGIKIRGLEAFVVLCGGSVDGNVELGDDLDGFVVSSKQSKTSNSTILDKYTVQEKIVPLLKVMKTKEPAVMMAALAVFRQIAKIADSDFLAMDVLPILWSFSLGPLLNLQQFQEYMTLIKAVSSRIEKEQVRKLQDLSSNNNGLPNSSSTHDLMNVSSTNATIGSNGTEDVGQSDFERLVLGRGRATNGNIDMLDDGPRPQPQRAQSIQSQPAVFSWSTPAPANSLNNFVNPISRAITPDNTIFSTPSLVPITVSKPSQPVANGLSSFAPLQPTNAPSLNWNSKSATSSTASAFPSLQPSSNYSTAPPPQTSNSFSTFSIPPPPPQSPWTSTQTKPPGGVGNSLESGQQIAGGIRPPPKKGLDAYESLI